MQCLFALSEAQRSRRCGEKHMSETVTGYIDHVIFRNEDNGYYHRTQLKEWHGIIYLRIGR